MTKLFKPFDTTEESLSQSLESLKNTLGTNYFGLAEDETLLSTEGALMAAFYKATGEIFSKVYNSLKASIREIGKVKNNDIDNKELIQFIDKYTAKMMDNYVYLVDHPVSVPTGLSGSYLDYLRTQYALVEQVSQVEVLVSQLRSEIGMIISTPNALTDPTVFDNKIYTEKTDILSKQLETLGKLRKGNDFTSKAKYGDVFRSNTEFLESVEITKQCANLLNKVNTRKLSQDITNIMEYTESLKAASKDGYSKVVVEKIGQAVYAMAFFVEAYSGVVFNQVLLNKAQEENVRSIAIALR